ncbi:MAG: hypothetical protein ACO1OF_19800 [Adhaeribacter sp.]
MESITSKYRQLCAVEIFHHYFLDEGNRVFNGTNDLPPARKVQKLKQYAVSDWLRIEPDDSTRSLMHACHIIFKPTKTGFILVTQTAGPDQASADLQRVVLSFYLRWQEPSLVAQTALPLSLKTDGKASLYVFSNEFSRNNRGNYPSICLPVVAYQNTRTYVPGEIVKSGGQQFVALNKTMGNAPSLPAFWRQTDQNLSYATSTSLQVRPATIPADVIGKLEITGKAGLGNFSVLMTTNQIKAAQVYQLHLDKF